MGATTIEWTDYTFNPWIGCSKVHEGCANCYAEADFDKRKGRVQWGPHGTRSKTAEATWRMPVKWNAIAELDRDIHHAIRVAPMPLCTEDISRATGLSFKAASDSTKRLEHRRLIRFNEGNLGGFLHNADWQRPRVFCASLADVFEDWEGPIVDHKGHFLHRDPNSGDYYTDEVSRIGHSVVRMDDLRRELFALIDATPNLDWLLLTKRPENIRRMSPYREGSPPPGFDGRMRFNVWLGTSVSNQESYDRQWQELAKCRDLSPVLFLSGEPLLDSIKLKLLPDCGAHRLAHLGDHYCMACKEFVYLDWFIGGYESGPNSRPRHPQLIRDVRDQCTAAGVPFLFKQWGEWLPSDQGDWNLIGRRTKFPRHTFDDGQHLFRVGKKKAGRLLDGKLWDELPQVAEGSLA